MAKQNARRRAAVKKQLAKLNQNPQTACEALWGEIDAGRGKKALSRLQDLQKAKAAPADFAALKFCAMAARARELHKAGLEQEAADLAHRVTASHAQTIADIFPSSSLVAQKRIIYWLPLDVVLRHIDALAAANLRSAIADKVMTAPITAATSAQLAAIGPSCAWLTDDNKSYTAARQHMATGAWAQARDALANIARTSAFSAWRLFCRCMAEHVGDDTAAVQEIGQRLLRAWPDFILAPVVLALQDKKDAPAGNTRRLVAALLSPQKYLAQTCDKLRALDPKSQAAEFGRELGHLSQAMSPNKPLLASKALLQALTGDASGTWSKTRAHQLAATRYAQLSGDTFFPVEMALCLAPWGTHDLPMQEVRNYFEQLKVYYEGNAAGYPIALAQALMWLAERLVGVKACEDCILDGVQSRLVDVFSWMRVEKRRFVPDILMQALISDPLCRAHYEAAIALLKRFDADAKDVVAVLLRASEVFVDDASWCGQLSRIYAERKDFVASLAQARRALSRAAHNPAYEALVAATLLRWANHSPSAGKFLATNKQFLQALEETREQAGDAYHVARLLGALKRKTITPEQAMSQLQVFDPEAQLRAFGLLIAHLSPQRAKVWVAHANAWLVVNKQRLATKALGLTQPLTGTESLAFEEPNPLAGLKKHWTTLLTHVPEADHTEICLRVLAVGGAAEVVRAINQRPWPKDPDASRFLQMVRDIARSLRNMTERDQELIIRLVQYAPSTEAYEMRLDILTRLVQAGEPKMSAFLRECLEEAQSRIHGGRKLYKYEDDEDDEDVDDDADDFNDVDLANMQKLIEELETLSQAQIRARLEAKSELVSLMKNLLTESSMLLSSVLDAQPGFENFAAALKDLPQVKVMLQIARIFFDAYPDATIAPQLRRKLLQLGKLGPAAGSDKTPAPMVTPLPF